MLAGKNWNANIVELINGASVNFIAKVSATILGLASTLLLARFYGADTVGTIATITSIVSVGTIFALSGFGTLVLKLIPTTQSKLGIQGTRKLYKKLLLINFSHALIVFFALLFFFTQSSIAEKLNLNVHPLLPGAVIIFTTLVSVSSNTLRGLGDYIRYSALDFLASLFVMLIIISSILANASNHSIAHLYFAAHILACLLAFALVKGQFHSTEKLENTASEKSTQTQKIPTVSSLYSQALPMFGVAASQILIVNIDVLTIGYFSSQNNVGIYSIYIKLVAVTAFATAAINSMFAPKVAVLFEQGKTEELRKFVKQTTLISSLLVLLVAVAVLLIHKLVLKVYGTEFLDHLPTMYVLLISTVVHTCFGSVGFFLNMTGRQRPFLLIMIFACAINITLNILLVPEFGMLGAAVATLLTTILWNTIATIIIYQRNNYTLLPFGLNL